MSLQSTHLLADTGIVKTIATAHALHVHSSTSTCVISSTVAGQMGTTDDDTTLPIATTTTMKESQLLQMTCVE